MAKGGEGKKSWAVSPDGFPSEAEDLWPDISEWPTTDTLNVLADARLTRPQDYQSVVNGLRWYTTGDMSSAWSLLTAWLAVVAIVFAALTGVVGIWALWAVAALGVAFTVMLFRVAALAADHNDRKRHSMIWIAALERDQPAPSGGRRLFRTRGR